MAAQLTAHVSPEVACVGAVESDIAVPLHSFKRSGFGPFATSRELRSWLLGNASRFDAIIAHSIWLSPTRYAALAARRAGIPFYLVPHGMLDPDALAHHAFRKWLRWNTGERRVLMDSTLVFSTSEDAKRGLRHAQLSNAKHIIIPNALDTTAPAIAREPDDPPLILCLNRLHPRKGALELAKALNKLAQGGLSFNAVFAGPEEDQDYASRCKQVLSGLGDRVSFLGNQPATEVQKLLGRAAMLIHPCVGFENFGMVIVEGIQAGVPVIASRRALVTPELESAQAVVAVEPDSEQLADAIAKVLGGGGADNSAARSYISKYFSLEAVGEC
ncbi:MAG: glycosyltransferase, partial [Planctomycetes bacterium]|nr:glycosyltransferase [Planctomycetota bacterium]